MKTLVFLVGLVLFLLWLFKGTNSNNKLMTPPAISPPPPPINLKEAIQAAERQRVEKEQQAAAQRIKNFQAQLQHFMSRFSSHLNNARSLIATNIKKGAEEVTLLALTSTEYKDGIKDCLLQLSNGVLRPALDWHDQDPFLRTIAKRFAEALASDDISVWLVVNPSNNDDYPTIFKVAARWGRAKDFYPNDVFSQGERIYP